MQAKDYYDILGVPEDADSAALKKAFRKIARDSHPDTHPGDAEAEARFKEASEAYEVLNDPEKRRKYDALRRYGVGSGPGGASFEDLFTGGGFPGGGGGGFRVHINRGDLHDMDFADIFNSGSPFSELFEQLFAGAGTGAGAGMSGGGPRVRTRSGRPAGFPRIEDRFFRQDGLDVHCTVWMKVEQLEKGAKVKVRTPSGSKALVRVPAGTRIGAVLRLPGQGLEFRGERGDQYVHVEGVA